MYIIHNDEFKKNSVSTIFIPVLGYINNYSKVLEAAKQVHEVELS